MDEPEGLPSSSDVEKGQSPSVETQECMSPASDDGLIIRREREST